MKKETEESKTGELIGAIFTFAVLAIFLGGIGYGIAAGRFNEYITDEEFEQYELNLEAKDKLIFELQSDLSSTDRVDLGEPLSLVQLTGLVKKARAECEEVQGGKLKMSVRKEAFAEAEPDVFRGDTVVFVTREIPNEITCTKSIPASEEVINLEIK